MTQRKFAPGLPTWLAAVAGLGAALVIVPTATLFVELDWFRLPEILADPAALTALWLSIRTSLLATVLCVVLGVPLAFVLGTSNFRGLFLLRAAIILPLVIPPVVSGLALLALFGSNGWLGNLLDQAGYDISFSTTAVVLAQTFVALPFLVLTVESAIRARKSDLEDVAATLGARPTTVWWRVSLPLVKPALLAGTILSFARALGEFGATITFAGSLSGTTRTLPLEIYLQRETDQVAAIGLSLILIAVAFAVIGLTAGRYQRS